MLVDALVSAGFSVQLKHDSTEKGTFRDEHGFVSILSEDGTELASDASFQHNRSYHERGAKVETLVAEVVKKKKSGKDAAASGSVVAAPAAAAL